MLEAARGKETCEIPAQIPSLSLPALLSDAGDRAGQTLGLIQPAAALMLTFFSRKTHALRSTRQFSLPWPRKPEPLSGSAGIFSSKGHLEISANHRVETSQRLKPGRRGLRAP